MLTKRQTDRLIGYGGIVALFAFAGATGAGWLDVPLGVYPPLSGIVIALLRLHQRAGKQRNGDSE